MKRQGVWKFYAVIFLAAASCAALAAYGRGADAAGGPQETERVGTDGGAAANPDARSASRASAAEQDSSAFAPEAPENSPLYWGNPSGAREDVRFDTNYLLSRRQYALSYNARALVPNWVMWHLCASDLGGAGRRNDFRPDPDLPDGWYAVKKSDYQFPQYGFDRGHLCPSADRSDSEENNSATFLMTNMIPQAPDCNRAVWKQLEDYGRQLAEDGYELYIAAGPAGRGGTGKAGYFEEIAVPARNSDGGRAIAVPAYCWKIILVLAEGSRDFERVRAGTPVIAVWIPNSQGAAGPWRQYLTTVDYIEEMTGLNFFSTLPDEIEDALESRRYDG